MSIFVALVTALFYFDATGQDIDLINFFNFFIPLFFLGGFSIIAMILIRMNKLLIWTPAFLFLAYTVVFSGLGPLIFILGNESTIVMLQQGNFRLSELELLGTNLLNLIGTSAVLAGIVSITFTKLFNPAQKLVPASQSTPPEAVAAWFFIFGFINKYFIVLPYKFEMLGFVPLGIFLNLEQLIDLGFALVAFLAVKKGGKWRVLLWIALPIHLAFVLLDFRKTQIVLAFLLPAFGAFLAHGSLRRLSVWLIVTVLVFWAIQPLVLFGRAEIKAESGSINNATLTKRLQIVGYTLTQSFDEINANKIQEQGSWMRVSYSGTQAWAMREWDRGNPNDTLSDVWITFIPRLLWPDKPIGLGPGLRFYQAVTGNDLRVRFGVTVYADAYWNGGWVAVILFGMLVGMFFGIMSKTALHWLENDKFLYFPAILLTANVAMNGLTGWLISGFFGVIPLLIAFLILIRFIELIGHAGAWGHVIKRKRFTS